MILVYALFAISAAAVLASVAARLVSDRKTHLISNVILLAAMAACIMALMASGYSGNFAGIFSINAFSLLFGLMFTIGLILVNLVAYGHSRQYQDFAVISDFSLIGMLVVASSSSLVTIFLGLELSSIPIVFAMLLSGRDMEAAAKFFIMASIALAVLSLAIVLVYGATGTLALSSYSQSALMAFSAVLFIASLGIEASIFPFNVLMPDVYSGSPAYLTGMLGGVNKKVGFAALLQVAILVFVTYSWLFMVLAALAVLTMFYGNIVALMQKNFKRMMAYSSISQAGYMMIGIAVHNSEGASATIFQIFSHLFLFIGIMAVIAVLESRDRATIDDLIGLNGENRLMAFALAVFMLSLVGMPFTSGFVGKFLIFISAVNSGMAWLAIIGIANSVISILYYSRAIMAIYTERAGGRPVMIGSTVTAVIMVCLAATVLLGVYPAPLISLSNAAAAFLYH